MRSPLGHAASLLAPVFALALGLCAATSSAQVVGAPPPAPTTSAPTVAPTTTSSTSATPTTTPTTSAPPAIGGASKPPQPEDDGDPTHLQSSEEEPAPTWDHESVGGNVLDLCALREVNAKQSVKQRVVMFAPSGAEQVDSDPKLAALHGSDHLRQAWLARMPMDRFYNVLTAIPGKLEWAQRETMPISELSAYVASVQGAQVAAPFAGDSGDPATNAAQLEVEKKFVGYSLGCTDYVIVSGITRVSVTWGWVTIEERDVHVSTDGSSASAGASISDSGKQLWLPSLVMEAGMVIFQREGDQLRRVGYLEGTSDKLTNVDQSDMPDRGSIPEHISAVPASTCAYGAPSEGSAALSTCGAGSANSAYIAHDYYEINDRVCEARDFINPDVWSECFVRTTAEEVVGDLQLKSRKIDAFRLFGVLARGSMDDSSGLGMAIGKHEGVKVGYAFVQMGADRTVLSFFKVTDVGPGGPGGDQQRTALNQRFGDAHVGGKLLEYPQAGWTFMPKAVGGVFVGSPGGVVLTSGPYAGRRIDPAKWVAGGTLSFALDFSPIFKSPEWYGRVDISVLTSISSTVRMLMVPIDWPYFEKGFYLGPRAKLTFELGLSSNYITAQMLDQGSVSTSSGPGSASIAVQGTTRELHGWSFGPVAAIGIDEMLSPEWALRLDVTGRYYSKAIWSGDNGDVAEWADRRDHLASIAARLGLGYTW